MQGTAPYNNMLTAITEIVAEHPADTRFRVVVPWIHGESDDFVAAGVDASEYAAFIIELQGDLQTDISPIIGNNDPVYLVLSQHSAWPQSGASGKIRSDVARDQLY